MNRYVRLLKSYCDTLIDCQVREMKSPALRGGILCPSCSAIHGRIADAVYPFVTLYDLTGEDKYLEAAKGVMDWSEANVLRPNGSYYNDKPTAWNRITVFSQIALGEALLYHGECLDEETKGKWLSIFRRQSAFIREEMTVEKINANINYQVGTAASMALAYRLLGEEIYRTRAYENLDYAKDFFTEDGLLFGECKPLPIDYLSPRGCRGIDIGYNAEETLPLFVLCAHYLGDRDYYELSKRAFRTHLEFMIPDGGWDDSFGCRSDKWSYWGSRTSDGCQAGLVLLAREDPLFAEAAERSFEMYEKCSHDGYLYGGYMYREAGEDPCVHHSFCHAKALASMLDGGFVHEKRIPLPRDEAYGLRSFPVAGAHLLSLGDFRATVSESDIVRAHGTAKSGGALTLLWHRRVGPILAASLPVYSMLEPRNMQLSRRQDKIFCNTPRIEYGGISNITDTATSLTAETAEDGSVTVSATGALGEGRYRITYRLMEEGMTISAESSVGGRLCLPVIAEDDDSLHLDASGALLERRGVRLLLRTESELILDPDIPARAFNPVGGFLTVPLSANLEPARPVTVKITVGD